LKEFPAGRCERERLSRKDPSPGGTGPPPSPLGEGSNFLARPGAPKFLPSPEGMIVTHYLRLDTGGIELGPFLTPQGFHSVAVGQGTLLVPAAHGPRREKPTDPVTVESPASRGEHGNKRHEGTAWFDPFRVAKIDGSLTVGGGHKPRALAHGYSILTPPGWEDACPPELHTPRVPPRMWDMLSPGQRVARAAVLTRGRGSGEGLLGRTRRNGDKGKPSGRHLLG
jgi:hypothetical protein